MTGMVVKIVVVTDAVVTEEVVTGVVVYREECESQPLD